MSTRMRMAKANRSLYSAPIFQVPMALDDAQHDAAEHRARDVADAAEHGGGEGLEAGDVAGDVVRPCRT